MIDLMLQADTHQAIKPLGKGGALPVQCCHLNQLRPFNGLVKARYGQTALIISTQCVIDDGDLWINEDAWV